MDVVFSDHAVEQLKERKLSEELILSVFDDPDKIIRQSEKRYRIQKIIHKSAKKYLLIVVYDAANGTKEIVTAFLTTKFKKYL